MFCLVKVCVRQGTGDLKSKFMTILESDSFTVVFEKIVGELSAEAALLVGDLQRVTLLLGAIEAEPESTNDAAGKYSSMGLKTVTFVVSQRAAAATAVRRTIQPVDLLACESMAGGLPDVLEADECRFRDLEQGKKWMCKFIKEVLYPLSTFHTKLERDHGSSIPEKFSFSAGANDYAAKKIKAPLMKQEKLAAARDATASLALAVFLDVDSWASVAVALADLVENLEKALIDMQRRSAAEKKSRDATGGGFFSGAQSKEGIEYKKAVELVRLTYVELNNEMELTSPYVPVFTTFFEPTIGSLAKVLKRNEGVSEDEARTDVSDGRSLLEALVPKFHSRAMQNKLTAALRRVAVVPSSLALVLYKEITGDESTANSEKKKERIAFASKILSLVGPDGDLVLDLRVLANALRLGKTCLTEFWNCLNEVLDEMVLAAEARRHGNIVTYLSEIISHSSLFRRALASLEAKKANGTVKAEELSPTLHWFEMQFWPGSEYVKSTIGYTGRFPLKLMLQTREQRKEHPHFCYTRSQNYLLKAYVYKFQENCVFISVDDKANGAVGEPGKGVALLSRQRPVTAIDGVAPGAMDHDQVNVKVRVVPTVMLVHRISPSPGGSWYRGNVHVSIKDSVFESSEATRACAELECVFRKIHGDNEKKSFFVIHSDGGPEHNATFPTVQAALVIMFLRSTTVLDGVCHTRSCLNNSWVHEVEQIMSILNLALYGVAVERPPIIADDFPGMEELFRRCKGPVNEILLDRFTQLQLKEEPFQRGPLVSEADADKFFASKIAVVVPDKQLRRREVKRADLQAGRVAKFFEPHVHVDPYKIEIRKTCWYG
ncbi:hypothetical protein M885DRAFT_576961 [Pelagophyceae sp. CCMP2097]|nr:hypothetical protein M885DRAFT_576961 [Pelagophyceae sp. CCMP2097]